MDDPIVFPGQPGASHLHDFFGNTGVDAFSTFKSMLAGETTCRVASDTAGYWTPTGYLDGVQIQPKVMRIYYLGPATGTTETIPGLQMVGEPDATSPAENPRLVVLREDQQCDDAARGHLYDCSPWAKYRFVDGSSR
jgi:hypothetical protein